MVRIRLVLAAAAAAAFAAGVTSTATADSMAPASCGGFSDLYAASVAQLSACALTTAPLSSSSALPGGGESYTYTLANGQTYSINEPPAGFDAATASPAVDAAYGLPPAPPTSSPGYASWLTVEQGTWATPPVHQYLVVGDTPLTQIPTATTAPSSAVSPAGIVSPAITMNNNSNWAGYSQSASGWTANQNTWTEPTFGNTGCANSSVSFWAGIGDHSNALGQAGTSSGNGSPGLHYVFYENLPSTAAFPGPQAPAGSQVIANVRYYGSNNWEYVVTVNGTNYSYAGSGNYDGSIAEEITERNTVSGSYTPLLNFKSVGMFGQVGTGLANISPDTQWNQTGYATTGSISGGRFTVTQNHCAG